VDYVRDFRREVMAFEAAARAAAEFETAPAVPSCPGWVMTDLILRQGVAHRYLARVIGERMRRPPEPGDRSRTGLTGEWAGWLPPNRAPQESAVPAGLLDWFHEGAEDLHEQFGRTDPEERVWTWSTDHTVAFWQRMQAIETAVHRWDAQKAIGTAEPLDSALATDAIGQAFEVMVPKRRAAAQAPLGQGERFLFRRADGPQSWAVRFDAHAVLLGEAAGHYDIEISGRACDLALFLWHRPVNNQLDIQGNTSMLKRYFALVPPGVEAGTDGRCDGAFG
jgi:uncharacterized protein (TIGR03083 family)